MLPSLHANLNDGQITGNYMILKIYSCLRNEPLINNISKAK